MTHSRPAIHRRPAALSANLPTAGSRAVARAAVVTLALALITPLSPMASYAQGDAGSPPHAGNNHGNNHDDSGPEGSFDHRDREASDEEFAAAGTRIDEQGMALVIVGLQVAFTPEGAQSTGANASQRAAIRLEQDRVIEELRGTEHRVNRRFITAPFVSVTLAEDALEALQASGRAATIQIDDPVPPALADSGPLVEADLMWGRGVEGSEFMVAILDTGVDPDHPFFGGRVIEEACFSSNIELFNATTVCPNGEEEQIGPGAGVDCDAEIAGCDHGTHVAGIAAGSGTAFHGVARDAPIMSIQVFSRFDDDEGAQPCDGGGQPSPCALSFNTDQMAALDRIHVLRDTHQFAAANMSLGAGRITTPCDDDSRKAFIDNLRSEGIATVISSGNSFFTDAVGRPACISTAVTVGSTTKGDEVSNFSNSHPTMVDLYAPGSFINSAIPGDDFGFKSGTSMAAPHVAGAWSLLRQEHPDASVEEILQRLRETGLTVTDDRDPDPGFHHSHPRILIEQAALLGVPELIQAVGAPDVWWLQNGIRYLVASSEVLEAQEAAGIPGWDENLIREVTAAELADIPQGPVLIADDVASDRLLVQRYPDEDIHYIDHVDPAAHRDLDPESDDERTYRRPVDDFRALEHYGLHVRNAIALAPAVFDPIPALSGIGPVGLETDGSIDPTFLDSWAALSDENRAGLRFALGGGIGEITESPFTSPQSGLGGTFQRFDNGDLQLRDGDGAAYAVHGAIHRCYAGDDPACGLEGENPGVGSKLGHPTSDEFEASARRQAFEGGLIALDNGVPTVEFALPSAPVDVAAAAGLGVGEITLTWGEPTGEGASPVTGYAIYRGDDAVTLDLLENVGPDPREYTDSGLRAGTDFFYAVAAVTEDGEGARSDPPASATTFPVDAIALMPSEATPRVGGALDITAAVGVAGSPAEGAEVRFEIYRDGDLIGEETGVTDEAGVTSISLTGPAEDPAEDQVRACTLGDGALPASCDDGGTLVALSVVTWVHEAEVGRSAGANRFETAVAISGDLFGDGEAQAVVLARGDEFPDALAGTPLAVREGGPLLLTARDRLRDDVAGEIERVLPAGGTVFLLGGPAALSVDVQTAVEALGYVAERVAGPNRFATAAEIARRAVEGVADPEILIATGLNFPDALAAGAAAAGRGAVVLTADDSMRSETQAFLDEHPGSARFAVGGPAAAAAPDATAIFGPDRFATAVEVARQFFPEAAHVGIATGLAFPDALGGGTHTATLGGPLLLSRPASVPGITEEELVARAGAVARATLYGGPAALSNEVEVRVHELLSLD